MKEQIFKILHNRDRMPGERFGDIEGKIEEFVNQEVEKRIAERMPSEEEAQVEAFRRFTSNTGYVEIQKVHAFVKGATWIARIYRSRLTNPGEQKTEGGKYDFHKEWTEGGGE